jgi:hypothetical protein
MVQGSKYADGSEAFFIVEAPNARTVRTKAISTQKHNTLSSLRRYIDGHELLSEYTSTQFLSEGGHREVVNTIDAVEDGRFQTVWYERSAEGPGSLYRWSSDLCSDANGNPYGFADGEACGPEIQQAQSGGSTDEEICADVADSVRSAATANCQMQAVAGLALGAIGGEALFIASAGTVTFARVDGIDDLCNAAADVAENAAVAVCEAWLDIGIVDDVLGLVAIPVEGTTGVVIGDDPCAAVGGVTYDGPPGVVHAGSCGSSESAGTASAVVVGADDAEYEITVYGDPVECESTVVTAADGMCVVIN